jgi:flagellar hook-length control protein FliK
MVSLQPASSAAALAASSNNNAAGLNTAQAAQAQNAAGQLADGTIPSTSEFNDTLLQQAQLQAGDKGSRYQGVIPDNKLSGVLAQAGLSGNKQQSTVQSALLGSSALTPASAQNGLQATDFSAFDNIFGGDLDSLPPALQEAHLEMAGIKADNAAASVKANNMIHARSAGYPHPATQAVGEQVNIMSSRTPQGDQHMRIQLDPPELGQVAIELKFGKDNSVKAHISVERPETLALLQKDSASLQKALEDAGLQADSGSLEFSLDQGGDSQNGESFGDKKGGSANNGSAGSGHDGLPEEIETQMTIFVDPHTGQQHVNMLV